MELIINGTGRKVRPGQTLADLLSRLGLNPAALVVELNGAIIIPEKFPETEPQSGDCLEILQFVGGG